MKKGKRRIHKDKNDNDTKDNQDIPDNADNDRRITMAVMKRIERRKKRQ